MAKDHVFKGKFKDATFIVHRRQGYAKKTVKGFRGQSWNSHHVLPCTSLDASLKRYLDGKAPHFREALARFTNWNVNDEPNLIGLPHEDAYLAAYGDPKLSTLTISRPPWMKFLNFVTLIPPVLPIHLPTSWGHPDYNTAVSRKLDRIWNQVDAKVNEHDEVSGKDLASEVQAVSNVWFGKLEAKRGQTKEAWDDEDQRYDAFCMPT